MNNTNKVSEETKFQKLHEDYKETLSEIREEVRWRTRSIIAILILFGIGAFFVHRPKEFIETFSQISSGRFGVDLTLTPQILYDGIDKVIALSVLFLMIKYIWTVFRIESLYERLGKLERELRIHYSEDSAIFTREEGSYTRKYLKFFEWIYDIVTFFPAAFFSAIILLTATFLFMPKVESLHPFAFLGIILIIMGCVICFGHHYRTSAVEKQKEPKPPTNQ